MNRAYLAIVGALTALMLFIFLVTDQPLDLTFTAVALTSGLALGAAYIYSREEAYEEAGEGAAWSEYIDEGDEAPQESGLPEADGPAPGDESEDEISSPS